MLFFFILALTFGKQCGRHTAEKAFSEYNAGQQEAINSDEMTYKILLVTKKTINKEFPMYINEYTEVTHATVAKPKTLIYHYKLDYEKLKRDFNDKNHYELKQMYQEYVANTIIDNPEIFDMFRKRSVLLKYQYINKNNGELVFQFDIKPSEIY